MKLKESYLQLIKDPKKEEYTDILYIKKAGRLFIKF
jgi:preprotein translocase subunit Sss1